ncbi:MAG: hypothetical protein TREMPRED_004628 [Tremellales sp. Tagirdzhanova-0007]|nr:MAG: hypothetical protein TREMPRED_004628 [Tremellales sp. Tagirdzhanova-0007]
MARIRTSKRIDSSAESSSADSSSLSSVEPTPSPTVSAPKVRSRVKTGWIATSSSGIRIIVHTLDLVVRVSFANVSLLVALIIKPVSEPASWELACWTAQGFWNHMQRHWEDDLHAGEVLTISGDVIPEGESAVIISNHLAYSDYYLVQALAVRAGMLGRCRYFVRKELVWTIPIFGFAFWAIGMILVSRNWTDDAALIEEAFSRIKKNKHDAWIVLYPEGTRRVPSKLLQARAFAKRHGKPELQNLLYPRTRGFACMIQGKAV